MTKRVLVELPSTWSSKNLLVACKPNPVGDGVLFDAIIMLRKVIGGESAQVIPKDDLEL